MPLTAPQDIADLQAAVEKQDFNVIRFKAHLLCGTLSSMKFAAGTEIARKAENHAKAVQKKETLESAGNLIVYLKDALSVTV